MSSTLPNNESESIVGISARPLITIATINLNNAHGLKRTLESFRELRAQNDIEFIFQDGGSTDNSLDVASTFYKSEEVMGMRDLGIYDAMNKSLERSNGVFIIWINSGDEFITARWDEIKVILSSYCPDMAIFASKIVNLDNTINLMHSNDSDITKGFPHPSTIFKAEQIKLNGGYDKSFRIAGDYDLILRLARRGARIYTSDTPISIFYMGGISSNAEIWLEAWRALSKNKILQMWRRSLNILKYYIKINSRLGKKLRLKKLSVLSKEKKISIYEIGGIYIDK